MAVYTCPTCGGKMERDLLLFTRHTDQHILDEIKRLHPNWVTPDGFCRQCLDHFKRSLGKAQGGEPASDTSGFVNIGFAEQGKRRVMGMIAFLLSMFIYVALVLSGAERNWRLVLFVPLFGSMLGFFQARRRLCVVLGFKGTRNMDQGEEKINDAALTASFRKASFRLIFLCLALALASTFILYLF